MLNTKRFWIRCLSMGVFLVAGEAALAQDASPSLQAELDKMSAAFADRMPEQMKQTFAAGVQEVRDSGLADNAVGMGDKAKNFELPGATGDPVQLEALLQQGPVVLTWYRGGWCPYCNLQLRAYQKALPEIQAAGGQLVAISPELPDKSLSTQEKNDLKFTVLSDVQNKVAKQYGLVYRLSDKVIPIYEQMLDVPSYNGDDSYELPLSATYVIDTDGTIRFAFLEADYTRRAEPADVVRALQSLR